MKRTNRGSGREIFTEEYWDKVFMKLLMRIGIFAITVTVIGVLATPIIMSVVYTWRWGISGNHTFSIGI